MTTTGSNELTVRLFAAWGALALIKDAAFASKTETECLADIRNILKSIGEEK